MTRGGIERQMVAIAVAPNRVPLLRRVKAPTLVIHGAADPLVPLAAGADTAGAIPDARFEVIDGMGHDLPPVFFDRITGLINEHVEEASRASRAA
jgi:proline iminopeptidase